jgi:CRISPR-associated protein Cas2
MKQFTIISYDISDDKRRSKAAKTLEDFGTRVQYSVFECRLEAAQLQQLKKRLQPFVKETQESVRIYYLSADDVSRIEIIGSGQVTQDKAFYLK